MKYKGNKKLIIYVITYGPKVPGPYGDTPPPPPPPPAGGGGGGHTLFNLTKLYKFIKEIFCS